MAKYSLLMGYPVSDGWHRAEVGQWKVEVASACDGDKDLAPLVGDVWHLPLQKFPTNTVRNTFVKEARARGCDFLFMVDADGSPPYGWFKVALKFLIDHPGPAVIAAPYCGGGGDGQEDVMVFQFAGPQSTLNRNVWSLDRIPRTDASRRTGIERVASIGTHCIGFSVSCFDRYQAPYFDYLYNEDKTGLLETEDCWACRHLFHAGVPIYCTWDHWASHYKEVRIGKPVAVKLEDIPEWYLRQARGAVLHEGPAAPPTPTERPAAAAGRLSEAEQAEATAALTRRAEAKLARNGGGHDASPFESMRLEAALVGGHEHGGEGG